MTDETLPTYRLDDTVAVISIDDGKANVFSTAVVEQLDALLTQALADGARAVVLVGRPGRFSAGFNLAEMTESAESMRALVIAGARLFMRIYGFELPTVAACTGHALAGGALTLLSCDVRVGADVPAKIGLNEVAIGMVLPQFAVELARERIRKSQLGAATMGAQVYDPAGALDAGYLDQVVPADDVLDTALAHARRLAELRTGAYAGTKRNVRGEVIDAVLAGLEADMAGVDVPKI